MLMWGISILFAVITLVLLSGKGSFLIAGYNTASKADKSHYNEKKLCRVVGSGFAVITVFLIIQAICGENTPEWFRDFSGYAGIGIVIVICILANTICKVKDGEMKNSSF